MALNIDLVNGGINIYETGQPPRTYFGAIGASGKIYPSGSINQGAFTISLLQNNAVDLSDGDYDGLSIDGTSGSGIGATVNVSISSGEIVAVVIDITGNGYAIGDTLTIDASVFGGTGSIILKVDSLLIDSILFVVGGDDYQIQWSNLVVNGTSPTSLSNAITLLSNLLIGVSGAPYKVYTALLTQNGGSDIQEQGGGSVTKGISYYYDELFEGSDFTNVGGPKYGDLPYTNGHFVATVTGEPINYDGTVLVWDNGAPVATVLENTIGLIWWEKRQDGVYRMHVPNSDINNAYITGYAGYNSNTGLSYTFAIDPDSLGNTDYVDFISHNVSDNTNDNSILINTPLEVRIYN